MKKLMFLFILGFTFIGFAQDKFEMRSDSVTGKPMIVGVYSRDIMYDPDWEEAYFSYEIDTITADELIPFIEDVKIKIVAATWCSDSRDLIPSLYKLLDYLSFPENDVEIIFVNREKKDLAGEVDGLGIELVPTIIFYKNHSEAGRIVEQPLESIERDILSILAGFIE